jgi:gliding motility-associated-like protein
VTVNGCTGRDTATVTVNPSPTIAAITGSNTICAGTTTTLSSATLGGIWTSSDSGVASIDGTSGEVTGVSSGSAIITYRITNNFGCSDSLTAVVYVNQIPAVAAITGTTTICEGTNTALASTTAGGLWTTNNPAVAEISSAGVVTGISAGTATITYSVTEAGCTGIATTVITVDPTPAVASITGSTTVCEGATTTLASATAGGVWTSDAAIATVSASGIVNGEALGSATITYTVSIGSCSNSVSAVINVNPIPTVAAITGTTTLCEGANTALASTTAGGVWTTNNPAVAEISSAGVVTGISAGTATITYSITEAGCTGIATTVITVDPTPAVASITGSTTVCEGATTTIASATAGGVWSTSDAAIATVSASGIVTGEALGSATITYTVSIGSCSNGVSAVINVNPIQAVASITGTTTICEGANTALASTTAGGVWTSSNTAVAGIDAVTGVVTGITAGTATITYSVTINGCTGITTSIFTVEPAPSIAAITGSTSICEGTSTILSSATTAGVWSSSNLAVATINGTSGEVNGLSSGSTIITYTVTNGTGCADSLSAVMYVNAIPLVDPITGISNVCQGASITLLNTTLGGVWSSSNTAVAGVDAVTGEVTGMSAGSVTITYSVTVNGCTGSENIVVNVDPAPSVASITGSTSICEGTTSILSSATSGGFWTSSNIAVATIDVSNGEITGLLSGSTIITYTISNLSGCIDSVNAVVYVNQIPAVAAITGTTTICEGANTVLASTTAGGVWTTNNPAVAEISSAGVVTGISAGTATITYSVTEAGCTGTATTVITVDPTPAVASITGSTIVCEGATTTLASATAGGVWSTSDAAIATVSASGIVNGEALGSATITYTVSIGSCSNSVSAVINVNPIPTVAAITGTTTLCEGATTTLSNSTLGGIWTTNNPAIAEISSTGLVTGISAGTATITYSITEAGCTGTATTVITVDPTPAVASITGSTTVCEGATTTLASATAGGVWTSDAAIATVSASGIVNGEALGSATITYTVSIGSCSNSVSAVINVNPIPTVAAITGTTTICEGANTALASTTAGGVWTTNNPAVAEISSAGVVTGISAGTATITYSITEAGCTGIATTVITVDPTPAVASITGSTNVCEGATTTLASATAGGVWSTSDAAIATVSASGIVNGEALGSATITYTVSIGSCSNSVSAVINVNPIQAVASITGTTTICEGTNTALASTTAGGVWTTNNPAIAEISSAGVVTGISAGTATITYSITEAGCTGIATTDITVNPTPVIASITGSTSVCAGSSTTLSSATTGGIWSSSNSAIAIVNGSGVVTGVAAGSATITYTITIGSCSNSVSAVINVNPIPTVAAITGTTTICEGTNTALASTTAGGVWTTNNPAIAEISSAGVVTGVSAGTATITYSVTTAGCTGFETRVVTVNPTPVVASISGSTTVCENATTILASATAGGVWTSSDLSVATINASTGLVFGVDSGSVTITYTLTDAITGCIDSVRSIVNVNPIPVVAAITGTATVCEGATTTLSNSTLGGVWTTNNPAIAEISSAGVVTGISTGTATITYSVSIAGCTGSITIPVTVNPKPVVASITGSTTVCEDAITILASSTPNGIWTSSNGLIASVDSADGAVTGIAEGSVRITYTVTNTSGCIDSVSAIVNVNPIPTVAAITGTTTICEGATTVLENATAGGVWSSTNTAVAGVDAQTGEVTGMSSGTAVIAYSVTISGCTGLITTNFNVNPVPAIAAITGSTLLCEGFSTTLSSTTSEGVWTSSNMDVATADASTGEITGIAAGNTIITYTVTNGFGCTDSLTTMFFVNPIPFVDAITGTTTICEGVTTFLANATAGGLWSSSNTAVAGIDSQTGEVTGITSGNAVITYAVIIGSCTGTTSTIFTVNQVPQIAAISGSNSICEGSSTTLSSTTDGGIWSSSNTSIATANAVTGEVSGISPGNVIITYTLTNSSGCTDSLTTMFYVNQVPSLDPITGTTTICEVATTNLSSNTTGGVWNTDNSAVAEISASGEVMGLSAGTATITYSVTTAGCTGFTTTTVTVDPLPVVASITGSTTVCEGATTIFASSTPGGVWTSSDVLIAAVDNDGIVTGVSDGSVIITYTITNGSGCVDSVSAVVNVDPIPFVDSITGTTTICEGATTILSSNTTGGVWTTDNPAVAVISTSGEVMGLLAGTATITYSVTTAGCTGFTTTTFTVETKPVIATITGSTTVCIESTSLLASSTSGGTWTSSDASVAIVDASGLVTGISEGNVIITYTINNGSGCVDSVSAALIVNPLPIINVIEGITTICNGTNTMLTNATTGGVWTTDNPAVAQISDNGEVTGYKDGIAIITYTLTQNGCTNAVFTEVTIHPLPVLPPILSALNLCENSTNIINYQGTAGAWVSTDSQIATVDQNGQVTAIKEGTTLISYIVTNAFGCTDSVTTIVKVNAIPTQANAGQYQYLICGNTETVLNANTPVVGEGTWSIISGNAIFDNVNDPNTSISGLSQSTTVLMWTIANGLCTPSSDYVNIIIECPNNAPVAILDTASTTTTVPVLINVLDNDYDVDGDVLTVTIVQQPANGNAIVNIDGSITYRSIVNFIGVDTLIYKLCDNGVPSLCDTALVIIRVDRMEQPLTVNNAISPNGDGVNDEWIIQDIENYPVNMVKLFNRWGAEVWSRSGYDNRYVIWRGENNLGDQLPSATYYYIIFRNGAEELKGWIYLDK